jgi:uncharacterized membrane protein
MSAVVISATLLAVAVIDFTPGALFGGSDILIWFVAILTAFCTMAGKLSFWVVTYSISVTKTPVQKLWFALISTTMSIFFGIYISRSSYIASILLPIMITVLLLVMVVKYIIPDIKKKDG